MPEIHPDNEVYLECFTLCDSQLRVGVGGMFGLDWNAVIRVAETMNISVDEKFFRLLKIFENEMVISLNKREVQADGGAK